MKPLIGFVDIVRVQNDDHTRQCVEPVDFRMCRMAPHFGNRKSYHSSSEEDVDHSHDSRAKAAAHQRLKPGKEENGTGDGIVDDFQLLEFCRWPKRDDHGVHEGRMRLRPPPQWLDSVSVMWRGCDLMSVLDLAFKFLRLVDENWQTLRTDPHVLAGIAQCNERRFLFGPRAIQATLMRIVFEHSRDCLSEDLAGQTPWN